ncbi:MAG: hypothetical protein IKC59_04500 [Clostridia bacterium]|nr:hypothetical protein [Clostridia bacterium]
MRQLNVPKRMTATIQVWVSIVLLIVATCLSLSPIITLNTGENVDKINEMIEKVAPAEGDDQFVIPETIDISAIKLVKSIGVMGKVMSTTINAAKAEDMSGVGSDIADIFKTEEGQETIVIAMSLVSTVASNFDKDESKEEGASGVLASVLTTMVSVIALLALLALTFIVPIMLLVSTLTAIVPALAHLKDPEEVSTKIARKLPGFISLPFSLMLFQCVVPGMTYGVGIIGICIAAILSAVLGLVISRLRTYEPAQFRYLNIVQGVSALGIVGFMVFFFNLLKTNIFTNFLHGKFAEYVTAVGLEMVKKEPKPVQQGYLIDLVLILVYVVLAMSTVAYLEKCTQRLACTAAANKKGAFPKDSAIVRAVLMLAVYILPTVVMGRKSYYEDPTSTEAVGDGSFLVLNGEEPDALKMVLVGIIIMLVAEIALIVLKIVFCKGMNRDSMTALMSGADTEVEAIAETDTTEAPAEEAAEATEEAAEAVETAEEAVAEETEEAAEEVAQ